jgi:hypothetical protein
MWRYLAGVASALALMGAGFFLLKTMAGTNDRLIAAPPAQDDSAAPISFADVSGPPSATETSKEEKRFNRYDKDKNGAVSRAEYLLSRQKAYAKLDLNGDGTLSFDEYAVKATTKFAKADGDKSGVLNRTEFSTTRVVHKDKPKPKCAQVPMRQAAPATEDVEEG